MASQTAWHFSQVICAMVHVYGKHRYELTVVPFQNSPLQNSKFATPSSLSTIKKGNKHNPVINWWELKLLSGGKGVEQVSTAGWSLLRENEPKRSKEFSQWELFRDLLDFLCFSLAHVASFLLWRILSRAFKWLPWTKSRPGAERIGSRRAVYLRSARSWSQIQSLSRIHATETLKIWHVWTSMARRKCSHSSSRTSTSTQGTFKSFLDQGFTSTLLRTSQSPYQTHTFSTGVSNGKAFVLKETLNILRGFIDCGLVTWCRLA